MVEGSKPFLLAEGIPLGFSQVFGHHFRYQLPEAGARFPAQLPTGLGDVPQQGIHFRGPEIASVDRDDGLSGLTVDALLVDALSSKSAVIFRDPTPLWRVQITTKVS